MADRFYHSRGYAYSGALYDLGYEVTGQVSEIIREIAASAPKEGTPEEKIKNLYENILDWDARNKAGITPIKPYLDAIGRGGEPGCADEGP